jgi:hypothetical protein
MTAQSYFQEMEVHLVDSVLITPKKSYEKAKNLHEVLSPVGFRNHRNS